MHYAHNVGLGAFIKICIFELLPGVPKKSSGVWLNAEKKVLNLAISNQSSEMLDIST